MAQINVNVPDKLLNEEAQKTIKSLKRSNQLLKSKIKKLETLIGNNREIVKTAKDIIEAIKNVGGLDFEDYGF